MLRSSLGNAFFLGRKVLMGSLELQHIHWKITLSYPNKNEIVIWTYGYMSVSAVPR